MLIMRVWRCCTGQITYNSLIKSMSYFKITLLDWKISYSKSLHSLLSKYIIFIQVLFDSATITYFEMLWNSKLDITAKHAEGFAPLPTALVIILCYTVYCISPNFLLSLSTFILFLCFSNLHLSLVLIFLFFKS